MSLDFSALRPGAGPDCPSDHALERYQLQVADPAAQDQIRAHLTGCATCTHRMAQLEAGFDAFPELDPRAALARARRGQARPSKARWWAGLGVLAPLAAAALVFVLVSPDGPDGPLDPGVRSKGAASLRVFRQTADAAAEEVLSGATVSPGDRLRFVVDLPSAGALQIYVVDGSDTRYLAWPLAPDVPVEWPAGKAQSLPGAVELDDSPGPERLFLVHCPGRPTPPECGGAGVDLVCPEGCSVAPFTLRKAP